ALAFALLTPNVNGTSEQAGHDRDLRINGGRTTQLEYYIDGVPVTTGYQHEVPPSVPSMEAIGEFKVLTNGLSAEYGRLSGGAITLVTRSGTNAFHGSAYEYLRNDKLNANDWNSNRFGRPKGVFHDNVFGGTFGGPVRVPKLYNGRDKTFFFLNYEGTRHSEGSNAVLAGVPTPLERQGDFSQSLIDRGVPVQIFDPLTARSENARVVRDPFPGARIPNDRFNPISKLLLDFYPLPTRPPQPNSSHDQNYVGSTTNLNANDRWTGRLDENWTSRHATHFTLTRFDANSSRPRWLSALQPVSVSNTTAHTASLEHVWTLTPSTIVNLRGGFVRLSAFTGQEVNVDASNWPLQRELINLLGTTRNRVPSFGTGDTITGLGGGSVNDAH
ncbi:MAG TPA: Plug domain-containing protein, partial [Planctomycetaceae bacterium]|nr:Plug domain-containing protein [Planctomycetaceae bacterium]